MLERRQMTKALELNRCEQTRTGQASLIASGRTLLMPEALFCLMLFPIAAVEDRNAIKTANAKRKAGYMGFLRKVIRTDSHIGEKIRR